MTEDRRSAALRGYRFQIGLRHLAVFITVFAMMLAVGRWLFRSTLDPTQAITVAILGPLATIGIALVTRMQRNAFVNSDKVHNLHDLQD